MILGRRNPLLTIGIQCPVVQFPFSFPFPFRSSGSPTTSSCLSAAILLVINPSYGATLARSILFVDFFATGRGVGRVVKDGPFGADIATISEDELLGAKFVCCLWRFFGGEVFPFPSDVTKLFLGRPLFLLMGPGLGVTTSTTGGFGGRVEPCSLIYSAKCLKRFGSFSGLFESLRGTSVCIICKGDSECIPMRAPASEFVVNARGPVTKS